MCAGSMPVIRIQKTKCNTKLTFTDTVIVAALNFLKNNIKGYKPLGKRIEI